MSDGPIVSRSLRRRCPYRVEQLHPGRFIVVERMGGDVVEAGFVSYEAAWGYIVNQLLTARERVLDSNTQSNKSAGHD